MLDSTIASCRPARLVTADLLALLGELDARRLYLGEGCSSLFTYCTQVLHLSEHAAYHRIEAARAARRFPIILELVADGSVTLTTVALLRPHLTAGRIMRRCSRPRGTRASERSSIRSPCLAPRPDAKTLDSAIAGAEATTSRGASYRRY